MDPRLALVLCFSFVAALIFLDRNYDGVTRCILLPLFWFLLVSSRYVSMWLNPGLVMESAESYVDGSPLDRLVFLSLIALGVAVLATRREKAWSILRSNGPLIILFLFGLASVLWADFPVVSLKRWIKTSGNLVMILLVLTEPNPLSSMNYLFKRGSFFLLPTSVLLINYFPHLGRGYHPWTGEPSIHGVAMDKNFLGNLCMILFLFHTWFLLNMKKVSRQERKKELFSSGMMVVMSIWLIFKAKSVTSLATLFLGFLVILFFSRGEFGSERIKRFEFVGILVIVLYAISEVLFGISGLLLEMMGRDSSLTDRLPLWNVLLGMNKSPLLGYGFDGFWLGQRVEYLWSLYWWRPNQAHNGYIEIFLNLGLVGLGLFFLVLKKTYQGIRGRLLGGQRIGVLLMAYFISCVFYNFTEAGFRGLHPIWFLFLFVALLAPSPVVGSTLKPED